MRGFVPPDPETAVSTARYAVVHTPHRRRKRFPAGIVELVADAPAARTIARERAGWHAAQVLGPSKSSEGQFLFYLIEWLDDSA